MGGAPDNFYIILGAAIRIMRGDRFRLNEPGGCALRAVLDDCRPAFWPGPASFLHRRVELALHGRPIRKEHIEAAVAARWVVPMLGREITGLWVDEAEHLPCR